MNRSSHTTCFVALVLATLPATAADPFAALVRPAAPEILREVNPEATRPDGIRVREVVFKGHAPDAGIYAVVAVPKGDGPHPGLLVLHGGAGWADKNAALRWAKEGFIAVAPDLPGIGEPTKMPHSNGRWKSLAYGAGRFEADPDITRSTIFDAVTAGLGAFHLLAAQPEADQARLGITGISWGGYTTTMLAGLLGDQVKAALSIYGAGFYDEGSTFAESLGKMPEESRRRWLEGLDAGRRATGIRANYFIAVASNDSYFYPPSVIATLEKIPGPTNWVIAPNADHSTNSYPGGKPLEKDDLRPQDVAFFKHQLMGEGDPFPVVLLDSRPGEAAKPGPLRFTVKSQRPVARVRLHHAADRGEWKKRKWRETEAKPDGRGGYTATLALDSGDTTPGHWFVSATDDRPVTVSSRLATYLP